MKKFFVIFLIFIPLFVVFHYYINNVDKKNIYLCKVMIQIPSNNYKYIIPKIKTTKFIKQAIKEVDLTTHIWGVKNLFQSEELYTNSPIKVKIFKGKDILFKLKPINSKYFELYINKIKRVYRYGQKINNKHFSLIIYKTNNNFKYSEYKFISYNLEKYISNYIMRNLIIEKDKNSSKIFYILYLDTIQERAKNFTNLLSQIFIKNLKKEMIQDINNQINLINEQINNTIFYSYKPNESNIQYEQLNTHYIQNKILHYKMEIKSIQLKKNIINNILNKLKNNSQFETLSLAGLNINTNDIQNLISQLQQLILEKSTLSKEYTSKYPKLQEINLRIKNLKKIIKNSILNIKINLEQKEKLLQKELKQIQLRLKNNSLKNFNPDNNKQLFSSDFYSYLLIEKLKLNIKKQNIINNFKILDSFVYKK